MKNKAGFMLVIAFLSAIATTLSVNARDLARAGKLKPTDSELYVRKGVTPGGSVNLLEGMSASEIGITNFDGQRLDADRIFVISEVTVNYGIATTGTSAKAVDYVTALPLALKNSHLVVKQDNEVILKLPITSINESKSSDNRYRELEAFALLQDQRTTSVDIEFPAGADLAPGAGNTGYVEVLFKGFETYVKR